MSYTLDLQDLFVNLDRIVHITPYDILAAMLDKTNNPAIHATYDATRYFEVILEECGKLAEKGHWVFTDTDAATQARREYAQKCADLHYWVATHDSGHISNGDSIAYKTTEEVRNDAIRAAYPKLTDLDMRHILDIYLECNESIQYCVEYHFKDKLYMTDTRVISILQAHFGLITEIGPIAADSDLLAR